MPLIELPYCPDIRVYTMMILEEVTQAAQACASLMELR
jgi:hypothetical protein